MFNTKKLYLKLYLNYLFLNQTVSRFGTKHFLKKTDCLTDLIFRLKNICDTELE